MDDLNSQTRLIAIVVGAIVLAGGMIAILMFMQPTDQGPSIQVIGKTNNTLNVTLAEMQGMTVIAREGSFQNSYGNIRSQGFYKGVKLADLVELVGGMGQDDVIIVNASDGYSQTFSYHNVFPSESIFAIQGDFVLAFECNDTVVPEYEEGYRIMFLPEDGYFSNDDANATIDPEYFGGAAGPKCVSNVASIQVKELQVEEIALTLINGDNTVQFTLSEIKSMNSVSGLGGYKKSTGTIVGPHNYTGVHLENLLKSTGNLPPEYTIEIIAGDGYKTYLNRTEVEGTLPGYDKTTGDGVGVINSTVILAYYEGGEPLPEGGPLRIVTLHESYLTDGHYWSKDVVKIQLIDEVDPWHLELHGVEVWNMTHDTYYSLASCSHHRTEVTSGSDEYSGVPLYIIVSAMDGGDDEHYLFNTTLLSTNYNVTLYDSDDNSVTFNCWELTQNTTIIVAGWINEELLSGEDWPIKLVSKNVILGNIVKAEIIGWDE